MDPSTLPRELRPFLDESGRLRQWPSLYKVQRMAVALLARRFTLGHEYAEREVNEAVMDGHTFADWALLRRCLVDWGFMARESDGTRYRLRPDSESAIERELRPGGPAA